MVFDTRIAVILSDDLLNWQKLNVTAFTVSGIASIPEILGENYQDATGITYLPMIRQPITIFTANRAQLRSVYEQALQSDVQMSIYTQELFSTPNDEANRAAVRAVPSLELNLVGVALRAKKKTMDKLLKGLQLHP